MRYVAFDVGERRVGVATGDTCIGIAFPQRTLDFGTSGVSTATLVQVCMEHDAEAIVVGLPLSVSGEDTPQCEPIRRLARELAAATGLEVILRNEALTTVAAERLMRAAGAGRRQLADASDSVAAQVLLQELFDELGRAT